MENQDLKKISAAKAAPNDQMVIDIPKLDIGFHYSSLTDYLDKAVDYNPKMLSAIDDLIIRFHLDAVIKLVNGHMERCYLESAGIIRLLVEACCTLIRAVGLSCEERLWWNIFIAGIASTITQMMKYSLASIYFQTSLSPSCKRKRLPCSVRLPNPPSTGWQSGKAATSPMA